MSNLFFTFLSMSVLGSILTLILLILRPILKKHTSKTWQYYIFLLVLIRLVLPLGLEIPVTVAPDSPSAQMENPTGSEIDYSNLTLSPELPAEATMQLMESAAVDESLSERSEAGVNPIAAGQKPFFHRQAAALYAARYLWLLWFSVSLLLLIAKVVGYRSFLSKVNLGSHRVSDSALLEIYENTARELRLKSPPPLYQNDELAAPMLIGTFNPVILLPAVGIDQNQTSYVLRHELTHFKRHDVFYKWLVQFALCLHWFNPFVYWISRETERNCELSCDEAVVKAMDREERIRYGNTLLDTINPDMVAPNPIAAIHFSKETKLIKERLGALMVKRKKSKFTVLLTICLTVVLFCGAAISGIYAADGSLPSKSNQDLPEHSPNPVDLTGFLQPASFDYDSAQFVRTLDSAGIENITIAAQVCSLILEETTEDHFEAYFSYPETAASNYEKYFDLQIKSENGTAIISTEYDDHGFDPIEGYDDEDYSSDGTLLIKIPSKHYKKVDLSLSVIEGSTVDFNVDADSLNIRSHVDNDVIYRINRSYDNLYLDHYVGTLRLELNQPSKNILIDNSVALLTLAFPENPENISLIVHNKEEDGEFQYPASLTPVKSGNTYSYAKGDKSSSITVNNNWLGSLELDIQETTSRAEPQGLPAQSGLLGTFGQDGSPEMPGQTGMREQSNPADPQDSLVPKDPVIPQASAAFYTDPGDSSFARAKHYEIDSGGNYFTWGRIDVVDSNGYDHQGMVIVCYGSDDFTSEYRRFIRELQTAYPDDYGYIAGYRDVDNGPRTYRTVDIDFMVVKEITYTDRLGVARTGVVVAGDGSEDFLTEFGLLYSRFFDAYMKD